VVTNGQVVLTSIQVVLTSSQVVLTSTQAVVTSTQAIVTNGKAIARAYDRASGRIIINLKDGSTFMFPHELGQGLEGANPDELAAVEVTPSGIGLHWETLDVDLTVPSLLRGIYGTKAWMAKLKHKQSAA
jgi:Protein of unknown function (DUF2442)